MTWLIDSIGSTALSVKHNSKKPGRLSVCCSMRVDEEAVTR